jgi:hypothetical protein
LPWGCVGGIFLNFAASKDILGKLVTEHLPVEARGS